MNERRPDSLTVRLRPYLFIACIGALAFAPVSFMLQSLKNDVVALEYPINYFMSQCIHNGEMPYWFNTWGMGFPLQSNLTWGIFSTPQMLFCSIFRYDMYALHAEFTFFVMLTGWSMFYLLKKHFVRDSRIALTLACCYMLSGFIAGSGQWMLYVTAAAFIPLVLHGLLQLLKAPSLRHAIIFAFLYYIMFTSVYAAFSIITTYALLVLAAIYLFNRSLASQQRIKALKFLGIAGLITTVLCIPCLLATLETLKNMSRGNPISGNTEFFNSNYLHPGGLTSLLLPFSTVRMSYPHTEGTMLDTYMGLFVLLTLPIAMIRTFKEKDRRSWLLFGVSIFFLLISFGPLLPLRSLLNFLPGFSYFRNPAIFRSYSILFLILYLGWTLRNFTWNDIFIRGGRPLTISLLLFGLLTACVFLFHISAAKTIAFSSPGEAIKNITFEQSLFISAAVQLLLLALIFYSVARKKFRLTQLLLLADLVINVLLCTPYFAVSRYSLPDVNRILLSAPGFPIQQEKLSEIPATYIDDRANAWNNVNIFRKQVSVNDTYLGPLALNNFSRAFSDGYHALSILDRPIAFIQQTDPGNSIQLLLQRPTHIQVDVSITMADTITILQNYYKGWRAYYNNQETPLLNDTGPGMRIVIPEGKAIVDFRYERKDIWIPALILHLLVLVFLCCAVIHAIRKKQLAVQLQKEVATNGV